MPKNQIRFLEESENTKSCFKIIWTLKGNKFQNEFLKSSFLPKYEPKIVRISDL